MTIHAVTGACSHVGPCAPRFARAAFKAFVVAYGVQAGFKAVMLLVKKKKDVKKLEEDLKDVFGKDSLEFGGFFMSFVGGYVGLLCLLNNLRGSGGRLNATIAGGLAASSILLDTNKERRYTFALYTATRTIDTYYERWVRAGRIKPIPYGGVLLFCICQVAIMYAFILEPELHSKSYYRLILRWSDGIKENQLDSHFRGKNGRFEECNNGYHPESCPKFLVKAYFWLAVASAKIYLPIVFLPIVLMKSQKLLKSPVKVLSGGAAKLFRSSMFLATYVVVMRFTMCASRNYFRRPQISAPNVLLGGFFTGTGLLFEKEPRHRELVLYVLPRAAEVVFTKLMNVMNRPMIKNGEILLFILSAAPLMAMLDKHPEHVPHLTKSVLLPLFYPKQ